MKKFNIAHFRLQSLAASLLMAAVFFTGGAATRVLAHGGEDHGGEKPKTETTDKGTATHTTRVGDLEVMLKHERLVPDAGNAARLFVTKYETNEGFAGVVPAIEIEAANGAVTQATIEKTDTAGSFTAKFPALPEGTYLVRAKLAHDGETDTATFSGVSIAHQEAAGAESGSGSWLRSALMALAALVILGLFGALIYFAARVVKGEPVGETASGTATTTTTTAAA